MIAELTSPPPNDPDFEGTGHRIGLPSPTKQIAKTGRHDGKGDAGIGQF